MPFINITYFDERTGASRYNIEIEQNKTLAQIASNITGGIVTGASHAFTLNGRSATGSETIVAGDQIGATPKKIDMA